MFKGLSKVNLQIVIDAMEQKLVSAGSSVITQGQKGDCLYVVDEGELSCFKKMGSSVTLRIIEQEEEPKFVRKYKTGEVFGELALLYNAPRAANIKADTNCILFALDRQTFNHIVRDAAIQKKKDYESFLRTVPILQNSLVDKRGVGLLADVMREQDCHEGSNVITEGSEGDEFYIVMNGSATAFKKDESGNQVFQKTYEKGHYFGERALIRNENRAATIVAGEGLRVAVIDRDSFKRVLGPLVDQMF